MTPRSRGTSGPVLPRVSGYVERVLVSDNQHVDAGHALLEVDPKELDLKVAEADAALQNAVANQATAQAALAGARASAQNRQGQHREPRSCASARRRATSSAGYEPLQDRRDHGQPAERHQGRLGHGIGRAQRRAHRGPDGGPADRRRGRPGLRRQDGGPRKRPPTWTTQGSSARTGRSRPPSRASCRERTSSPASTSRRGRPSCR